MRAIAITTIALVTLLQANYPLVAATFREGYERWRVPSQPPESQTGASPHVTKINFDYFIEIGRHEQTGAVLRVKQGNPALIKREPCLFNAHVKEIFVMVPNSRNFLDEQAVVNLTRMVVREFEQRCPEVKMQTQEQQKPYRSGLKFQIRVYLFTETTWARFQQTPNWQALEQVSATYLVTPAGSIELEKVTNLVKQRQIKAAEAEARLRAQQEQQQKLEDQRRAEQARIAKENADREVARQERWNNFVRRYGIQEMIGADALTVNPFAYQGKTVAIHSRFERMVSPDTGLFAGNIMVTGLPRDLFKAQNIVVLVGRVMGISGQVPQLKFVGVHLCQDYGCSDLLAQR